MSEYSVAEKPYHIAIVDHILDNVHGQIGLTPVENAIERLPIFKRLHNISQLGLVNRIFPCAVHTRYSHSLGVMHVASLMTESINGKFRVPFFDDDDIQVIRLAGLLHDIGHYPMSHNIEAAYKARLRPKEPVHEHLDTYVNCPAFLYPPQKETKSENEPSKSRSSLSNYSGSQSMHHEYIGYEIITNNKTLFDAVRDNYVLIYDGEDNEKKLNPFYNYKKEKNATYSIDEIDSIVRKIMTVIGNIVIGNYSYKDASETEDNVFFDKYSAMVQLIHSEMDADNIDYLLRDATFSGTTYGTMDMSLLISALTVSKLTYEYENNGITYTGSKFLVGILKKRAGCVEQFLLSKYMAYGQVVFSKYVSILEAMLFRVACKLITDDGKYGRKQLKALVQNANTQRDYLDFNDSYILNRIRTFQDDIGQYCVPSPDQEMFIQINDNLAFDMMEEVSSVSLKRDTLIRNIKKSDLYKSFCKVCNKLGDQTEKEVQASSLLTELISYRFESYSLTKQLPYDVFLKTFENDQSTPLLSFQSHYFRLANGIPVLETNSLYSLSGTPQGSNKLPQLVVDLESSLLHEIYSLSFVFLRKYKIENNMSSY